MRIVRWSRSPSAVVRIAIRDQVVVAIPPHLLPREVLDLARLVLNSSEFEELRIAIEPDAQSELEALVPSETQSASDTQSGSQSPQWQRELAAAIASPARAALGRR